MANPSFTPARSKVVARIMQHLDRHENQTSRAIAAATGDKLSTVETYIGWLSRRTDEYTLHVSGFTTASHPRSGAVRAATYSKGVGEAHATAHKPYIPAEIHDKVRVIPLDPLLAAIGGFLYGPRGTQG